MCGTVCVSLMIYHLQRQQHKDLDRMVYMSVVCAKFEATCTKTNKAIQSAVWTNV